MYCYIVKAWRCSFRIFLHGLAFVVFFVFRITWCCYLEIIMKHPSCRSKLQSLAPIQDMFQQRSQYICCKINHCIGLYCYYPAATESNNNDVFCFLFCISCLLYQHLPLGKFSCVLASEAVYFRHGVKHGIPVRQPSPGQPVMSHISGREVRFLHANCSPIYTINYKPTGLKQLQIRGLGFADLELIPPKTSVLSSTFYIDLF